MTSGRNPFAELSLPAEASRHELVPKKGLEPPHPCEYMDLNHARLPIPPLRHARDVQRERLDWQQFLVLQSIGIVSNGLRRPGEWQNALKQSEYTMRLCHRRLHPIEGAVD